MKKLRYPCLVQNLTGLFINLVIVALSHLVAQAQCQSFATGPNGKNDTNGFTSANVFQTEYSLSATWTACWQGNFSPNGFTEVVINRPGGSDNLGIVLKHHLRAFPIDPSAYLKPNKSKHLLTENDIPKVISFIKPPSISSNCCKLINEKLKFMQSQKYTLLSCLKTQSVYILIYKSVFFRDHYTSPESYLLSLCVINKQNSRTKSLEA